MIADNKLIRVQLKYSIMPEGGKYLKEGNSVRNTKVFAYLRYQKFF